MEDSGEGAHVSKLTEEGRDDDRGRQTHFSEYARGLPPPLPQKKGNSFLRGCGIAFGIAFLLFAFVVGACFIKLG